MLKKVEVKSKIWLSSPHMTGEEINYIQEAIDSNWVAPQGPHIDAFEQELSNGLHHYHVGAFASGTSALHLALILAGVQLGDEVICQSLTFSASANPIIYQGAIPVFVDSERHTWNMDPDVLKACIDDRIRHGKKPKCVIVVHLYGMPAHIEEIKKICNDYEIVLIEDAAEALGSSYKGKALSTFGDYGILSFNGNKIITTSGGGALVSRDPHKVQKAKFLSSQARDNAPHYQHSEIGYNYRMSNISAGIGRAQLKALPDRVQKRRLMNQHYRNLFSICNGLCFQEENKDSFSNYWLTAIIMEDQMRNDLIRLFEQENIDSRPLWKPMHMQPIFEKYPYYGSDVSEKLFDGGICLPSGSNLSDEEIERITSVINRVIG